MAYTAICLEVATGSAVPSGGDAPAAAGFRV